VTTRLVFESAGFPWSGRLLGRACLAAAPMVLLMLAPIVVHQTTQPRPTDLRVVFWYSPRGWSWLLPPPHPPRPRPRAN